jgi:hypothetical protein
MMCAAVQVVERLFVERLENCCRPHLEGEGHCVDG